MLAERFKAIADLIFEKLSYRPAPFRMFDRAHIFKDLKFRLLNNLLLASKVAERDGIAIIQRYQSIESYFLNKYRHINKVMYRKNQRQRPQVNKLKVDDILPSEQQKAAAKVLAQLQRQVQNHAKVKGLTSGGTADPSMAHESFLELNRQQLQKASATAQGVIGEAATGALPTHLDVADLVYADADEDDDGESESSPEEEDSSDERCSGLGHEFDLSNQNAHGRGGKKVNQAILKEQRKGLERDCHFVGQLRQKVQKMNRRIAREDERKRLAMQHQRLKARDAHQRRQGQAYDQVF